MNQNGGYRLHLGCSDGLNGVNLYDVIVLRVMMGQNINYPLKSADFIFKRAMSKMHSKIGLNPIEDLIFRWLFQFFP